MAGNTDFFNLTKIKEEKLLKRDINGAHYKYSPRAQLAKEIKSIIRDGKEVVKSRVHFEFIDAQKEAEIGIGKAWDFDDLKNDECIMNENL